MSDAPQIGLPGIEAQRGDVSSDACFTPPDIVNGVIGALGGAIDTDPCWHPGSFIPPGVVRYDGRELGDGLQREWLGAVWMNPPYSDPMPWVIRFRRHAELGHPAIALVKLDPSTAWWKRLTHGAPYVGLLAKRVAFLGDFAKGNTPNMVTAFVSLNIDIVDLEFHLPMAVWWRHV